MASRRPEAVSGHRFAPQAGPLVLVATAKTSAPRRRAAKKSVALLLAVPKVAALRVAVPWVRRRPAMVNAVGRKRAVVAHHRVARKRSVVRKVGGLKQTVVVRSAPQRVHPAMASAVRKPGRKIAPRIVARLRTMASVVRKLVVAPDRKVVVPLVRRHVVKVVVNVAGAKVVAGRTLAMKI